MTRFRIVAPLLVAVLVLPAAAQSKNAPYRAGLDRRLAAMLDGAASPIPVIVRFAGPPTDADGRAMLAAGFRPGMIRYRVVPAVAATGSPAAIRRLAADPRVAYIEHDAAIPWTLDRAAAAGRASQIWDATYRLAGAVHDGGFTGRGIGIAIVDAGVDATHPDLLWKPLADASGRPAKTIANFKMVGRDSIELLDDPFVEANTLAVDMADTDTTSGHGTHVAGIAAGNGAASGGRYSGAAPGANLIGFGAGEALLASLGLAAFDYIHAHHAELGIRVVNNSWGGAGEWDPERAVTIAARRLVNEDGLVVVFAAGNSGGDGSTIQTSVWGNIPEMIQVANYYDRTGWLDPSSSRGKADRPDTWPDVAAPGTQVISTAAIGKPVAVFGTTQDALLNELEGSGEPYVVPAPLPEPVEASVAGRTVQASYYASFTGTSMAAPFVAGVAALILEANPALTPFQVRAILRETANLPPDRTVAADGYAMGRGVVDAAEAVAVALRMRDGDSLAEALASAYVDTSSVPYALNLEPTRSLRIDRPAEGATVPEPPARRCGQRRRPCPPPTVAVSGEFFAGPVTDNTIPLLPVPEPVPVLTGTPHIYHAAAFSLAGLAPVVVAAGEPVRLSVRSLRSDSEEVPLTLGEFTVAHRILRDGADAYGPFEAAAAEDSIGGLRADANWTVPSDAPPGDYLFRADVTITSTNQTYVAASLPFTIAGASAPAAGASAPAAAAPSRRSAAAPVARIDLPRPAGEILAASTTFFSDGFEQGAGDWTVRQDALIGPGLLTNWTLMDENNVLSWAGTRDSVNLKAFYAGLELPSPFVTGVAYTDLADTSLVSPPIDLTEASSATLSYWRAGLSEQDFDFLRVHVAEDGTEDWTLIDEMSGDLLSGRIGDWENQTVELTAVLGKTVRLRFQFVSDESTPLGPLAGWYVDDIEVTGTTGPPTAVVVPALAAAPAFGVDSLETTLVFGALSNVPIDGFEIDFGDGSPAFVATEAGSVSHTYAAGQWTATLTVTAGATVRTATASVDVAPSNRVQVRVAGGRWVDAGAASGETTTTFAATLDLTGVEPGPATIEARHVDPAGRIVRDSVGVIVV